jgi:hypothetical protein
MATCVYPDRDSYLTDELPEGWDEWRAGDTCEHDDCREIEGYARSYQAEAKHRESIAIAREDLDMPFAPERDLMIAIQLNLK